MPSRKPDIRSFSPEALTEHMLGMGEKAFRAKQVYEWLWRKGATDFASMTNLSVPLREKLAEEFDFVHMQLVEEQVRRAHPHRFAFDGVHLLASGVQPGL